MMYSNNYLSVFNPQRTQLDDDLTRFYSFICYCKTIGHHHSWRYISLVADALTAYNELCDLDFFVKMKHFESILLPNPKQKTI